MERISCTDDEDDLLELYAAVIQAVFNDRVENEEIERLDVADIPSESKQVKADDRFSGLSALPI